MEWLRQITTNWLACIKRASKEKQRHFGDDAREAMRFFDGPYDFLYTNSESDSMFAANGESQAAPSFKMTYNKVAEAVQLFGPTLYHRNPHRMVTPSEMPAVPLLNIQDPQSQAMIQQLQQSMLQQGNSKMMLSWLLEPYLNYTPNELDLRKHGRDCIDEALIKGMGLLWTTTYRPPGSPIQFVGSFFDSVDHLLIDPDAECLEKAKWIARRRIMPIWECESRFNLYKGETQGSFESYGKQSALESDDYAKDKRNRGKTNDLIEYYEIYSRMGVGHRLKDLKDSERVGEASRKVLDKFGDFCFLAVTDCYPFPLNMNPRVVKTAPNRQAFLRAQWPTPFWADPTHPWPFTQIEFHRRPRKVWPMSHFKPAMGELKFLNWAFSFIACKIKNTSRDFVAMQKSVGEELKSAILAGKDLTLLEIEGVNGRNIQEVVSFLQHPNFNGDIYKVIDIMMTLLDRRLGINELMYGESKRQLRSASEAQIKGDNLRIRPDDMAECVENAMTMVARKEALCSRWHLAGQDVAPILGMERAMLWDQIVANSQIQEVVYELDYRIEAGSIRKPNKHRQQENANSAAQSWAPLFTTYFQMTGDPQPINTLLSMWAKAFDEDPSKFQLKPPPPPQPDPQKQQEAQLKQQEAQLKARIDTEKAQMDAALKSREAQQQMALDERKVQMELFQDTQEHRQEMAQDQSEHEQEIRQDQENHLLEMLQMRQKGQLELELAKEQGDAQVAAARAMASARPKANGTAK